LLPKEGQCLGVEKSCLFQWMSLGRSVLLASLFLDLSSHKLHVNCRQFPPASLFTEILEFGSPLEHIVVGKFVVEHCCSIISAQSMTFVLEDVCIYNCGIFEVSTSRSTAQQWQQPHYHNF